MRQVQRKEVDVKKLLRTSLWMNMIQLILIVVVIGYALVQRNTDLYSLIYVALGITALNGVITIGWYRFTFQSKSESLMDTLGNLEALNSKLREQRHDYLNHIQVIYGLLELEEYEEARKYMEPVYKDILKVSKALKTSHPAINALLQAKMQMADNYGIDLYLEIKSNLKAIPLEPWELCKVLSNLIDNGMSALGTKHGVRNLYIDVSEGVDAYEIQ
ncbi:MAG: sensor histidine kinase, partial [Cellulosilyticaceae bacterium]